MLPNIQFCLDSDQILLRIWLDLDLAVNLLRSAQNTHLTAKPSQKAGLVWSHCINFGEGSKPATLVRLNIGCLQERQGTWHGGGDACRRSLLVCRLSTHQSPWTRVYLWMLQLTKVLAWSWMGMATQRRLEIRWAWNWMGWDGGCWIGCPDPHYGEIQELSCDHPFR